MKCHRSDGIKKSLFLTVLKAGMSKIMAWTDSASGGNMLPGTWMRSSSCTITWWKELRGSVGPFLSWSHHPEKLHFPTLSSWRSKLRHKYFGDTNIQTIAGAHLIMKTSPLWPHYSPPKNLHSQVPSHWILGFNKWTEGHKYTIQNK